MQVAKLGVQQPGAQALRAALDKVKPNLVALKSMVILESPRADRSTRYMSERNKPDTAYIVHAVQA